MKYLLIGKRDAAGVFEGDSLVRPTMSGLYAWLAAFSEFGSEANIDTCLDRDFLEQYDIVHVNYVHSVGSLMYKIREQLGRSSSTKLVVNVDHAVGMWDSFDMMRMKRELDNADVIFHVEPVGAKVLWSLLGRNVNVIPHPVDDIAIDAMVSDGRLPAIDDADKWDIACVYHRYQCTYAVYYALFWRYMQQGRKVALINYTYDPALRRGKHPSTHFNAVVDRTTYADYITNVLPRAKVVVDMPPDIVAGRSLADAYMLRIPVITTKNCYLGEIISARTCCKPNDLLRIKTIVDIMLRDDEERKEATDEAYDMCRKQIGLEASYKRMVSAVEDSN